jgi:hypothetical protein
LALKKMEGTHFSSSSPNRSFCAVLVAAATMPARTAEPALPTAFLLGMKTDGNGRKNLFLLPFLYFLVETGAGSENAGTKTESEYADIRKRTDTDGEPEN